MMIALIPKHWGVFAFVYVQSIKSCMDRQAKASRKVGKGSSLYGQVAQAWASGRCTLYTEKKVGIQKVFLPAFHFSGIQEKAIVHLLPPG